MSEENKDLGDKAEETFDKAKDAAKDAADDVKDAAGKAKEKAAEFADDAKEAAGDFAEEAKETAKEFSEGVKDTLNADNKKILAGILAIVLGAFGVHKFILGYQKEGIILLVISVIGMVLTCVGVGVFLIWGTGLVGLIEGIIYLTKSDEEFYNTYQVGKKPWF